MDANTDIMVSFVKHHFTNTSHVFEALKYRNDAFVKRIRKTLIENGIDESQLNRLASITGTKNPPSVAIGSMAGIRNYGAGRTYAGLKHIVRTCGASTVDFMVFDESVKPEPGNCLFDLRTRARPLHPQLKRNYDHCFAMFRSVVGPFGITPSLRVIGLKGSTQAMGPTVRFSRTAEIAPTQKMTLPATSVGLATVAANMWEMTCIEGLIPYGPSTPENLPKIKKCDRRQELDNLLVQAQLPIKRAAFGHGAGKRLVRNVMREIDARAAGQDLMAVSPLQVEGIAAFLAELPYDAEGGHCVLPVVRPV